MVSVLPAHIALEMKNEMLRKTRKAQMKSMLNDDEFANSYPSAARSIRSKPLTTTTVTKQITKI